MILQDTVQGGRRKGRQKKRWEYNKSEWTGLGLGESLPKAEDREEWRKVAARSSWMPPTGLFVCLFGFLMPSPTTRLYRGRPKTDV